MRLQAIAGMALLLAWYAVAGVTVTGLLWFADFCYQRTDAAVNSGLFIITVSAVPVCVGVAVTTAVSVVASSMPSNQARSDSLPVSREQAQALWSMVDDLAERLAVAPPEQIRLVPEANAKVVERTALLGLLGGTQFLYLGVPLLLALDTDELRAVLCHELSHHGGGHTRYGAVTIRVSDALDTALQQTDTLARPNSLNRGYQWAATSLLRFFAAIYNDLTISRRHAQEFAADASAARITGTETTVRALHAYYAASKSWHDFDVRLLRPSQVAGVVPDDPFAAYAKVADQLKYRTGMTALRERPLPAARTRDNDPHPSLAQREDRLLHAPRTDVPGNAALTPQRLDGTAVLAALLAQKLGAPTAQAAPDRRTIPWTQWLAAAGEFAAADRLTTLAQALARLDTSVSTDGHQSLSTVLDHLESNRTRRLLATYAQARGTPRITVREAEQLVVKAVVALVERNLVASGQASWHVDWGTAIVFVCPDLTSRELDELVRAAVRDPTSAGELRRRLTELGTGSEPSAESFVLLPSPKGVQESQAIRIGVQIILALLAVLIAWHL